MKKILYMLFLVPVCILTILAMIYLFSKKEPLFFLQNVKINGINQLNDKEIMGNISPFLKESLLKIDVAKIKDAIASHPFVKEVRIKRVYPFSIVIDVKEKIPSRSGSIMRVASQSSMNQAIRTVSFRRGRSKGSISSMPEKKPMQKAFSEK